MTHDLTDWQKTVYLRDAEFLIELPRQVQILRLLKSHGQTGST